MIEKLINSGSYKFEGTIEDLKKVLKKFRVTRVTHDGNIQGVNIFTCEAEFEYDGTRHIEISKDFLNDNLLHITYKGCY